MMARSSFLVRIFGLSIQLSACLTRLPDGSYVALHRPLPAVTMSSGHGL
jgi:hypothetical protein